MAFLVQIDYQPLRLVHEGGECKYEPRPGRGCKAFPVIFWQTGQFWTAANLFALSKHEEQKAPETIKSLMGHLYKFSEWIEENSLDWQYFPVRKDQRVLNRFRGYLTESRDKGLLSPSTVVARMGAVIQFYRYTLEHRFLVTSHPLWKEWVTYVKYFNGAGFQKGKAVIATDLGIRNRKQHGTKLEDGLLPLSVTHRDELLTFLKTTNGVPPEVYLMLLVGFYSGARFSTIATLRLDTLHDARPDVSEPGLVRLTVGPGTNVKTKFDVSGDLLMPSWLLKELKRHAASVRRKKREVHAVSADKGLVFLTKSGQRFLNLNTQMFKLRLAAVQSGLMFMEQFRFHQTRATFGTQLMAMALQKGSVRAAIAFVRDALLHKNEAMTFRYVKFIEETPIKAALADEFTWLFMKERGKENS